MKPLVLILTSHDTQGVHRALSTLPTDAPRAIVVNSQDTEYSELIQKLFPGENIVVTHSNGTPGQGKQSCVDYFLLTNHEYYIHIDGDDFLYPGAYEELSTWPDLYPSDVYGIASEDILYAQRYFLNWRSLKYEFILNDLNISDTDKLLMEEFMRDVFGLIKQAGSPFNRIIMMSRQGAELCDYNKVLTGSEDVLQSAKFKLLHFENKLTYTIMDTPDIYVYVKNIITGAGKHMMETTVSDLRTEFFQNLTPTECDFLRNRYLPLVEITEKTTEFNRKKTCIKTLKNKI